MGNHGDTADLEALEGARTGHEAEMVREAAGWAVARIEARAREARAKG